MVGLSTLNVHIISHYSCQFRSKSRKYDQQSPTIRRGKELKHEYVHPLLSLLFHEIGSAVLIVATPLDDFDPVPIWVKSERKALHGSPIWSLLHAISCSLKLLAFCINVVNEKTHMSEALLSFLIASTVLELWVFLGSMIVCKFKHRELRVALSASRLHARQEEERELGFLEMLFTDARHAHVFRVKVQALFRIFHPQHCLLECVRSKSLSFKSFRTFHYFHPVLVRIVGECKAFHPALARLFLELNP
mmetsp:Transcript_21793/g.30550  ORF Transcript_21793/g.30550 Transcript_21793/m.30550 type:complete len:248 (-) Transcript_21793:423-1166(-)